MADWGWRPAALNLREAAAAAREISAYWVTKMTPTKTMGYMVSVCS